MQIVVYFLTFTLVFMLCLMFSRSVEKLIAEDFFMVQSYVFYSHFQLENKQLTG